MLREQTRRTIKFTSAAFSEDEKARFLRTDLDNSDLKDKSVPKYYGPNETATGQIRFIGIDDHGTPSIELTDKNGVVLKRCLLVH